MFRDIKILAFLAVAVMIFVGAQKLGLIHGADLKAAGVVSSASSNPASALATVEGYYDRWNAGDYAAMYSLLSTRMKASHPSLADYVSAHKAVSHLRLDARASTDPDVIRFALASDQSDANGQIVTSRFVGHWSLVRVGGQWRLDDEQIAEVHPNAAPISLATAVPSVSQVVAPSAPPMEQQTPESKTVPQAVLEPSANAAGNGVDASPEPSDAAAAVATENAVASSAPVATTTDPCAAKGASVFLVANPIVPIDPGVTADVSVYVAANGSVVGVSGNVPNAAISAILGATFRNCTGVAQNVPMRIDHGQLSQK